MCCFRYRGLRGEQRRQSGYPYGFYILLEQTDNQTQLRAICEVLKLSIVFKNKKSYIYESS